MLIILIQKTTRFSQLKYALTKFSIIRPPGGRILCMTILTAKSSNSLRRWKNLLYKKNPIELNGT